MVWLLQLPIWVLETIYLPMKLLPLQNKLTVISRQSDSPTEDIALLARALREEAPGLRLVVLTKKIKKGMLNKGFYCLHILLQMYHIATSKAIVLDSYCIPASVLHHRKATVIIQMWHALGAFKKFGHSVLQNESTKRRLLGALMKMHNNYDYVLTSSQGCRKAFSEAFNCNLESVRVQPLPRLDLIRDAGFVLDKRREIMAQHPGLSGKKTLMYAPTYRGENGTESEHLKRFEAAINEVAAILDWDKYNLVLSAHPNMKEINADGRIVRLGGVSSLEILAISDYVITDYSSFIFDALAIDIPVLFFPYDYSEYQIEKGFYLDYDKDLPGPVCMTAQDLIREINQYDDSRWTARRHEFTAYYIDLSIPQCSKAVAKFVLTASKANPV